MTHKERKAQMTVRLDQKVLRAAKETARRTGLPVAVVVANATRDGLLPPDQEDMATRIEQANKAVLTRLNHLESAMGGELVYMRELLALFARAYFNHTPSVPEPNREAASLSGRARFERLLGQLHHNLREGMSILQDQEKSDVA